MILLYMSVYKEPSEVVIQTLNDLISIGYTKILVRFDGTYDENIYRYCIANSISCIIGTNLKQQVGGGAITHEYIGEFLNCYSNFSYLIKIDPDTKPLKALSKLPIFIGSNISHKIKCLYGGCIIYSRRMCFSIYESRILLSNKYCSSEWLYFNYNIVTYLPSQDLILYDVLSEMNILKLHDNMSEDLHCHNKLEGIDRRGIIDGRYCFVHPKNLWHRLTQNG